MTFLPKSEEVGVFAPYSINTRDIGVNWKDLSISIGVARSLSYLGSGIAIIATNNGHIWRSTDSGAKWTDLGAITGGNNIFTSRYLSNGIVIIGTSNGHIWRSTDYGDTWTDLGAIVGPNVINTSSYLGNGIVIIGTSNFHVWRSTDYGATWTDPAGVAVTESNIFTSCYLENGVAIIGTASGHIWRSTDSGITWTDLGAIVGTDNVFAACYLGNGIVIVGTSLGGHIWRSINYGVSWIDLATVTANGIISSCYLGNGIVIVGIIDGHIFRTVNFGVTWTDIIDVGVIALPESICYLGDGVTIVGTTTSIWRSDVAFKIDDAQVNYPRIPVDQTAVRALNVTFNNPDQTRSLMIMVTGICFGTAGSTTKFYATADTASPPITAISGTVGLTLSAAVDIDQFQLVAVVKPGLNYRINTIATAGSVVTLDAWFEMYI